MPGIGVEQRKVVLAERIGGLRGEGAFEYAAAASGLAQAGRDVIALAIGEPDFPTPVPVVEAAARALRDGATRYGPPEGIPELREAIAHSHTRFGTPAHPLHVVVTPGAKSALAYAILCLVRPGDEVLVPDPGFPIYGSLVRFAGGLPVFYPVRPDGDPLPDDLILARLSPRVRTVIVNSPHNPTGAVASIGGLERLAEIAERRDLTVISDEVYARLVHEPDAWRPGTPVRAPSLASLPGLVRRTVVIDGFSKAYSMTGWRLGYGLFPEPIARAAALLAVNVHSCVPAFVQRAGIAALEGGDAAVEERRVELRRRRDVAVAALRRVPGVACAEPRGAFYVFPDLGETLRRTGQTSAELCGRLLHDREVATLPGVAFGRNGRDALRIALTAPGARLVEAIDRLHSLVRLEHAAALAPRRRPARSESSGGAA